ncbi:MAG: mandelate racemase/muconate lactonizing enzyme family protein [Betaproteobacteria bacterium]|nr:mandelate racemase/muconate lactonizing enzyme family protein [Betaproteobacteria bacterium]
MKITAVETIQLAEFPNLLWVQIHTDEGLVGLGETFYAVNPVAAHIHETCAPWLLGRNPLEIDRISHHFLNTYLGFNSVGVEMRAASAIDIALWDLFGQVTGQPIYQLLGGASRDRIRVYNTCAGYQYVRSKPTQGTENFGLPAKVDKKKRPYEDLKGFLTDAGELAESLLDMGITGMKIWPFDEAAEASNGTYISNADLRKAMRPFEKIRKAVGDRMDIHVEFHSMWQLPAAIRIAGALEQFDPFWYEDPIKMSNLDALSDYAHRTNVWVTASETLATRAGFRDLFQKQAVSVCMLDVGWCGGLSESRKIATMAEAWALPLAPHDCTGPILLTASVHLSLNSPNALVQEMVRAFYYDWYPTLVTELPPVKDGFISAPPGPGLGTRLRPDVIRRKDATVRVTRVGK